MAEPGFVLPDRMPYDEYRAMARRYCEERGIPLPQARPSKPLGRQKPRRRDRTAQRG